MISLARLKTYRKLGLRNMLAVATYRLQMKQGNFVKNLPVEKWSKLADSPLLPGAERFAVASQPYDVRYFSHLNIEQPVVPNWLLNPFLNSQLQCNDQHWSEMSDFTLETGDVKTVWELSRFDWLIKACWQARSNGVLSIPVNQWIDDWCLNNPVNQGVNWKCAQESSIRAMNVVMAAQILDEEQPVASERFCHFLAVHIQRILPTIRYAKAQDNNHGTSEAVALFALGTVLNESELPSFKSLANTATAAGRKLLEERVAKLIGDDGVFSQYSVNYHRMMLDSLCFAELIRKQYNAPPFSAEFYEKAGKAAQWLIAMVDPISGDAPNIGANDGSVLYNACDNDFREFRFSCQLASKVFLGNNCFPEHKHPLLSIFPKIKFEENDEAVNPDSFNVDHTVSKAEVAALTNGFKRIGMGSTFAILKTPHDLFRPAQADALHLDVWHNGVNLIRDAGTYSYNPPAKFSDDLGDTRFHSTVEIDGRSQMNKLSRFLYQDWLASESTKATGELHEDNSESIKGCYQDYAGAYHHRSVAVRNGALIVTDEIKGCRHGAVIRFRLAPLEWKHTGNTIFDSHHKIVVQGTAISSTAVKPSFESRYYLHVSEIPVFEIELSGDSVTTTVISFVGANT